MNRKLKYWSSQISGWGLYVFITAAVNRLNGMPYNSTFFVSLISVLISGISATHCYRYFIKKHSWSTLSIPKLIPRVISAIILCAIAFHLIQSALLWALIADNPFQYGIEFHLQRLLVWAMLLLIWSLIYFGFHYFENFRSEEIKNLRFETARMETELNHLRSQLNPHFLFNALNTIKALIAEDPIKARNSINQLSNILRNTLNAGKQTEIPFGREIELIKDYLALEKSRYEDRLNVTLDIDQRSYDFHVPPLMIQTLIENGIKHGISKLEQGGVIQLKTDVQNDCLYIQITNSGQLIRQISGNGTGIENTKKRLHLLYGKKASFHMTDTDNKTVKASICIPRHNKTENDKMHHHR